MSERIDHAAEAARVLALPYSSNEASELNATLYALAQAQLALVEQQRIANLIAVASAETMDVSREWYPAMPLTYEHMRQEIAAALGIEAGENNE